MMPAFPWWAWAVLAALLGLGELHMPGAYLIWIALGAAIAAAADAAFGLRLEAQIATFLAASFVSCAAGYFIYDKVTGRRRPEGPLNQRDLLAVGSHGVVCTSFVDGRGKVRLGDSVWLAEGDDLPEGTPVVVTAVRGTSLLVEPAAHPAHTARQGA